MPLVRVLGNRYQGGHPADDILRGSQASGPERAQLSFSMQRMWPELSVSEAGSGDAQVLL